MARLVFLAVLLAAATYASADGTNTDANYLNISHCTDETAEQCTTCADVVNFTVGSCTKVGDKGSETGGYEATCEKDSKWTLKLFTDATCTPANLAHTITATKKCFDGKHMAAKVTTIGDAEKVSGSHAMAAAEDMEHTVTVNLCAPAAAAKTCPGDVTDSACPSKPLKVKKGDDGTECGTVKIMVDSKAKTYYYSAVVTTGAAKTVTLKLYTTQETCLAAMLPVFVGKDLTESTGATPCKDYQQKLNADFCSVPEETTTNTSTAGGDSGSAAVSAVLALLAAACAVWMM